MAVHYFSIAKERAREWACLIFRRLQSVKFTECRLLAHREVGYVLASDVSRSGTKLHLNRQRHDLQDPKQQVYPLTDIGDVQAYMLIYFAVQ